MAQIRPAQVSRQRKKKVLNKVKVHLETLWSYKEKKLDSVSINISREVSIELWLNGILFVKDVVCYPGK